MIGIVIINKPNISKQTKIFVSDGIVQKNQRKLNERIGSFKEILNNNRFFQTEPKNEDFKFLTIVQIFSTKDFYILCDHFLGTQSVTQSHPNQTFYRTNDFQEQTVLLNKPFYWINNYTEQKIVLIEHSIKKMNDEWTN